jgi:hypothetical protein
LFLTQTQGQVRFNILSDDVASAMGNSGNHLSYVRDPSSGRYFDALTDADVYCIPSEAEKLEAMKKHGVVLR